jgi:hypothetical protein
MGNFMEKNYFVQIRSVPLVHKPLVAQPKR